MKSITKRRDRRFMGRAIDLALLNYDLTGDNPSVGCIIVDEFGRIVGQGVTAPGGRPHAEQQALEEAGDRAKGATVYVTLEPCRERSTDDTACSQLLVDAGVARVVCAIADIHPKGVGGFEVLLSAGIQMTIGIKQIEALPLYENFFADIS
jgi:diaminohydroxyphosphoribosylaminopyrimidine deaminase/5-amino-6-(5-phosphoribosylamino)uracil reductase